MACSWYEWELWAKYHGLATGSRLCPAHQQSIGPSPAYGVLARCSSDSVEHHSIYPPVIWGPIRVFGVCQWFVTEIRSMPRRTPGSGCRKLLSLYEATPTILPYRCKAMQGNLHAGEMGNPFAKLKLFRLFRDWLCQPLYICSYTASSPSTILTRD